MNNPQRRTFYRMSKFAPGKGWQFLLNYSNQKKVFQKVSKNGVYLFANEYLVSRAPVIETSGPEDWRPDFLKQINSYSNFNRLFTSARVLYLLAGTEKAGVYDLIEVQKHMIQ